MKVNKVLIAILLVGLAVFAIAWNLAGAAPAQPIAQFQEQTCDPSDPACTESTPPVEIPVTPTNPTLPDVAVLIAIVAFFKTQFELEKRGVFYAVAIVGAALWFLPELASLFPAYKVWVDSLLAFVKWILTAMGSVDFVNMTGVTFAKVAGKVK